MDLFKRDDVSVREGVHPENSLRVGQCARHSGKPDDSQEVKVWFKWHWEEGQRVVRKKPN